MNSNFRDLMIDIETMGKHGDVVITQIGACFFDRKTGEIGDEFLVNVDMQSCINAGLRVDGDTIAWWLKQPKEIQMSLFNPEPLPLNDAIKGFIEFIVEYAPKPIKLIKVWCHASFDYPKLVAAFQKLSEKYNKNITFPFTFDQVKDIRTLTEVTGIDSRSYFRSGAHNALEDCRFQVKYVTDALNKKN